MNQEQAKEKIPHLLSELTRLPILRVVQEPANWSTGKHRSHPDMLVHTSEKVFIVEYKHQSTAETVGASLRLLAECLEVYDKRQIPLLVVPFMGDVGRRLCEESGVSWMDLSGNGWIHATGLHVTVLGRPNKFARPGRPKNFFAPKASRVARILLLSPATPYSQLELVEATGLTKGYVSKVVSRFEEAGLVARDENGAISPRDPGLLLDTWAEAYDFHEHEIHRGHIAVRSPQAALRELAKGMARAQIQHAATGLAAAWFYTSFAGYRLVTFYVDQIPDSKYLKDLGYREAESGGNVWLVVPKDAGVFAGMVHENNVSFASAVQAYLDLRGHPERSDEAAKELRRKCLQWNDDERR